jgi:putative YhdH/YhfP family quinone oxidoreductase
MNSPTSYRAMVVEKLDGNVRREVRALARDQLPSGDVIVEVAYSSLNYKDALAATGHPGVAKNLPLVPGIDAVGRVVQSHSPKWKSGQSVLVANGKFGTEAWGGYAQLTRVPADWLIPLPAKLSMEDAMALGTAGFTAAQCVDALLTHGARPEDGDIVVSGATGGVGILAVMLLGQLGFSVVASTGKLERSDWLKGLGAARVVDRVTLNDKTNRPLLSSVWQGAVDTVGGSTLATILRSTKIDGCVTACGLVGGNELNLTVYPFILRGVVLHGIDSANQSLERRSSLWNRLASEWRLDHLASITQTVGLSALNQKIDEILAGQIVGRTVVDLSMS